MMTRSRCFTTRFLAFFASCILSAGAVPSSLHDKSRLTRTSHPLWGDTHVHTAFSVDSYGFGNRRVLHDSAYRFARGEAVNASSGQTLQLSRPLDFIVIADHAENLGVLPRLERADEKLLASKKGRYWYNLLAANALNLGEVVFGKTDEAMQREMARFSPQNEFPVALIQAEHNGTGYLGDEAFRTSVWSEVIAKAEANNEPGVFTTFVGFEWTSTGSDDKNVGNLHRVVIFRDGAKRTSQTLPYSAFDSQNPEDLWQYLQDYVDRTGGEVLAIPHNGNTSNGEMFATTDFAGHPLDSEYVSTRARWEPIIEVTQIKGDGETHPLLSPLDEFADFERWDSWYGPSSERSQPSTSVTARAAEYARSALKTGLALEAQLGTNPFAFGLIGSSDTHTGLPAIDERNFSGKMSIWEPGPHRLLSGGAMGSKVSASGLAAVWAEDNSRESIFNALKRREVYATTGTRILLRFFGGWEFKPGDERSMDLAQLGYQKGVPMGAALAAAPESSAPTFMIAASMDPEGAFLDRLQIVKGWIDSDGQLFEKVFDAALSNGREPGPDGRVPLVGSTVDLKTASFTNSIGEPELAVVWRDPEFDSTQSAFYYARVLEIPTPSWALYDARSFNLPEIPAGITTELQERAYSSPIWYKPKVTGDARQ